MQADFINISEWLKTKVPFLQSFSQVFGIHDIKPFIHEQDEFWGFNYSITICKLQCQPFCFTEHLSRQTCLRCWKCGYISAVDKPKFMGHPLDHPWWKTGSPKSFLGCPNYFYLSLKDIYFLVINTNFACFLFNHVRTHRELGRPLWDFESHVGSPNWVMGHIWWLGDLFTAVFY